MARAMVLYSTLSLMCFGDEAWYRLCPGSSRALKGGGNVQNGPRLIDWNLPDEFLMPWVKEAHALSVKKTRALRTMPGQKTEERDEGSFEVDDAGPVAQTKRTPFE